MNANSGGNGELLFPNRPSHKNYTVVVSVFGKFSGSDSTDRKVRFRLERFDPNTGVDLTTRSVEVFFNNNSIATARGSPILTFTRDQSDFYIQYGMRVMFDNISTRTFTMTGFKVDIFNN